MKYFLLLALTTSLLLPTPSQSDTNHFGSGGVVELDLGDSEMPLTPKQERERKYDQFQIAEIMKKRKSGEGYGSIAKSLGMKKSTVQTIIQREVAA